MKKIVPYVIYVLLLLGVFGVMDLSHIRRESSLIALPDSSILALGDHHYHKLYHITEHSAAPDQTSGEVVKSWGLTGGIHNMGMVTAEQDGALSFSCMPRSGQIKALLYDIETKEVVFSAYILEEAATLPLTEGTYGVLLVTDGFSGKCQVGYENAVFETA